MRPARPPISARHYLDMTYNSTFRPVIDKLKEAACELTEGAKLLRIYWYDGAP